MTNPIGWTDTTWNPTLGCSGVSPACEICYAERVAARGLRPEHVGLTKLTARGPAWTGEIRTLPERLDKPFRWHKPKRIFVDSMSDLFHEGVPRDFLVSVFARMGVARWHTFQVLTKRAARLPLVLDDDFAWDVTIEAARVVEEWNRTALRRRDEIGDEIEWPLPNLWLGVSVEDQKTADRVGPLLATPAALRWVSYEPALEAVNFRRHYWSATYADWLDWAVIGGASGPGAPPCELKWIRGALAQFRAAGVPVYVEQVGRNVGNDGTVPLGHGLDDRWPRARKGDDPSEWPEDLRVREFPRA